MYGQQSPALEVKQRAVGFGKRPRPYLPVRGFHGLRFKLMPSLVIKRVRFFDGFDHTRQPRGGVFGGVFGLVLGARRGTRALLGFLRVGLFTRTGLSNDVVDTGVQGFAHRCARVQGSRGGFRV